MDEERRGKCEVFHQPEIKVGKSEANKAIIPNSLLIQLLFFKFDLKKTWKFSEVFF